MLKARISKEYLDRLRRSYPIININKCGEDEYYIDGLDAKTLKGFGQILQENENVQPAVAQAQPANPVQQQEQLKNKNVDFNAAMQMFIVTAVQPIIEKTIDEIMQKVDGIITEKLAELRGETTRIITAHIDELLRDKQEETEKLLELAKTIDENKKLNEDEHGKFQENVANMAKHLREIPLPQ